MPRFLPPRMHSARRMPAGAMSMLWVARAASVAAHGERKRRMKDQNAEARARLQASIDGLERRMKMDANDLEYETHLRQKRQLQQILDRLKEQAK